MTGNVALRRARLAAAAAQATQTAARGDRETEVADLLLYPLREPDSGRKYTIVRVETRSGLIGYGECAGASDREPAAARQIVIGKEATAYEVIRRQLEGLPGLQAAINMALLDIVGKLTKAPVYQVLGGPTRNKVRAMTALAGDSDAALLAAIERAKKAGHRAFVLPVPEKPNPSQAFVEAARRRLEALRAAAGDDVDFVLDGAGRLKPGEAAILARALERFHLLWFDEPSERSSLGAIRKLAAESVTPIGFGRRIHRASDFQDLLREEALDVLRPDISRNGIAQIRKMAALAETYYTAVAPYHDGGPVATAAALHLAASIPNFFIQQIPFPESDDDRRMRTELTGAGLEMVRDGFAALPSGPGLGITINEAALEKYRERVA